MNGGYGPILADYASGIRYEDLPGPVVARAKQLVLDGIACGLFGSTLPSSAIVARTLRSFESGGDATIWGTEQRVCAPHAALANGTAVHGFELDDLADGLHAAAVTLVPALAIAQQKRGSHGRQLITAIVAGVEVGRRVSACMGLEPQRRGFHWPALNGTFAAAAASGHIAGLNGAQMMDCLSHAATMAAGLMGTQHEGMMKRMQLGRAAQTGVYAALLAQQGFTGTPNIFEADYGGYCTSFSTEKRAFDLSKLVEKLGEYYYTAEIKFKAYSCRGPIQTALDVIRILRSEGHRLAPNDIDRVCVKVPEWAKGASGWKYVPHDVTSAQMNMSYGVAVMLLEGDAFVEQYTEEKLRAPEILKLAERVEVVHDPALEMGDTRNRPAVVEITLKSGRKVGKRLNNPVTCSGADLVKKFEKLLAKVTDPARTRKIAEQVDSLEQMTDVCTLADTLAFTPGSKAKA